MARYKNIAYIAHHYCQDTGNVREYFAEHSENFYSYLLPSTYDDTPAVLRHYKNGILIDTRELRHRKHQSKLLVVALYSWDYLRFLYTYRIRNTKIIFTYPTLAFLHSWTRLLLNNTSILWAHDYFPHARGMAKIYNALMTYYMNTMPIVAFLSPTLKEIYKSNRTTQTQHVVSFGIKGNTMKRSPVSGHIGYIGALCEGKGIDILLEAVRMNTTIHLSIIGVGPLASWITQYIQQHNLEQQVTVFGFVPEEKLADSTSTWEAAAALYEDTDTNAANITDPGKIKLYLGLRIPVIMTATSFLAPEVDNFSAGVVVPYTVPGVMEGLASIRSNYDGYEQGILALQQKWEYQQYYNTAFAFLA